MVDKHALAAAQSRAARCVLSGANVFRCEDLQAQIEKLEQIQREDDLRNPSCRDPEQHLAWAPPANGFSSRQSRRKFEKDQCVRSQDGSDHSRAS
jgi:hypothetical protein